MTGPGVKPHGLGLLPFMQWAVRLLYDSVFNHPCALPEPESPRRPIRMSTGPEKLLVTSSLVRAQTAFVNEQPALEGANFFAALVHGTGFDVQNGLRWTRLGLALAQNC